VNFADPAGLCDVIIGGLTMKPWDSTYLDNFAEPGNKIEAFPYSDNSAGPLGFIAGLGTVLSQAFDSAFDSLSTSTQIATAALIAAAQDPGDINVTTYSGGAQSFSQAYSFLQKYLPSIASRVNNVTYISPGSIGGTLASGNGTTTAVFGAGLAETAITAFSVLDPGVDIKHDTCKHGDVDCAFQQNMVLLTKMSGGTCTNTYTFFLSPGPPPPNASSYFYWMSLAYQGYAPSAPAGSVPSVTSTITYGQ